jgi:transcriptional regulator with XRE-family HTH domain
MLLTMMIGSMRRRLDERELGELIRECRREAGLSQAALAAALGTKQSVVSRWERGHETPRADTLAAILRACGYEADVVIRPRDTGVDRAQIRNMLRMTPDQRLQSSANVSRMLATARRA